MKWTSVSICPTSPGAYLGDQTLLTCADQNHDSLPKCVQLVTLYCFKKKTEQNKAKETSEICGMGGLLTQKGKVNPL